MITWCHNHHHHQDRRRDCRRQSHYSVFNIFSRSRSTSHVIATCSLFLHDQSHPLDKSLLDGRSSDRLQPRRRSLYATAAGPRTDRPTDACMPSSRPAPITLKATEEDSSFRLCAVGFLSPWRTVLPVSSGAS